MIKTSFVGLDALQKKLIKTASDLDTKAKAMAINKTAEKARAEINRVIPQEYAVKAAEVRNAIDLRRANGRELRAVISIFGSARRRGRSLNMIHFLAAIQAAGRAVKTRGSKAKKADLKSIANQLGFMVRRDGGLKKIPGAFIGNAGRTIFRRVAGTVMDSRSKYEGTKHGQKIEPMQVIGFSQMFSSQKITDRIMRKIAADFPVEAQRAADQVMRGIWK